MVYQVMKLVVNYELREEESTEEIYKRLSVISEALKILDAFFVRSVVIELSTHRDSS